MCSIEPPSPLTRAVATVPGSVTASWNTTMYWPGTTSGAARCATVSPGPPGPTGRVSTERDASWQATNGNPNATMVAYVRTCMAPSRQNVPVMQVAQKPFRPQSDTGWIAMGDAEHELGGGRAQRCGARATGSSPSGGRDGRTECDASAVLRQQL